MSQPLDNEEREKPLDPAAERVRRKLVRFMAINLGLLFLALMAVVAAIVYRANRLEDAPVPQASELPSPAEGQSLYGEIALPEGARIVGHALSGNRLSLQVELGDGGRSIFVYDIPATRMIGRFDIRTER